MARAYENRTDLDFHPVVNPDPQVLTAAQIDHFNEQGYIQPFEVFSPAEVARNRAYLDYLLAELAVHEPDANSYALNGYQGLCEGIYDIAKHPPIVDLVSDLIGPDVILWASHYFCKDPHDPRRVAWHQDASYWPITPSRTVTVWLAIDDADAENSAMQFIPGTHRQGHISWRQAKGEAVLDQEIGDVESLGEPFVNALPAGSVSLHADMLVHGSEPNASDRRRCGLTLRYCPPIVRGLDDDWVANAILCRGSDPTDYWNFIDRPHGNNVAPRRGRKLIAAN